MASMDHTWTHHRMVPKDIAANVKWRSKLLHDAKKDSRATSVLWDMCRGDLLFYINSFCIAFDPRRPHHKIIPWVTWPYQDETFWDLYQAIMTGEDVCIEKSRDMGASWMCIIFFDWRWRFHEAEEFLAISRKESYVDDGTPKSLLGKFDMNNKWLPDFLVPNMVRNNLKVVNTDNDSKIIGESTTGDAGRGDRKTGILVDEHAAFPIKDGYDIDAAVTGAANTVIYNSTSKGAGNRFYEKRSMVERLITLHWKRHPLKSKGMYYDESGNPRSPWRDREGRRLGERLASQEHDINYIAGDFQFFDQPELDKLKTSVCKPPIYKGELDHDGHGNPGQFIDRSGGPLLIWCPLANGAPPKDDYVLGVDPSMGSQDATGRGASNSVISIASATTGEKVAEYAVSGLTPDALAYQASALGRWFGHGSEAFLIWEDNGPGKIFSQYIRKAGYRNVYYRKKQEENPSSGTSDYAGWWSNAATKYQLLTEYRRALYQERFINRNQMALDECSYYIHFENGTVAHSGSMATDDPTAARENHGDRVIADALCVMGLNNKPAPKETETIDAAPYGSFAYRRRMRELQRENTLLAP